MAERSRDPRLLDILENIVTEAVAGRDYASFRSDTILRMAIERGIEIVSEAVRRIPDQDRGKHLDVPWRNITAIGNKLRHEYHRVDADIIWEIATVHLPGLRPVIEAILNDRR